MGSLLPLGQEIGEICCPKGVELSSLGEKYLMNIGFDFIK
jgi:hypothetical protein